MKRVLATIIILLVVANLTTNQMRVEAKKRYCIKTGCNSEVAPNDSYCYIHRKITYNGERYDSKSGIRCYIDGCNNYANEDSLYCSSHRCSLSSCSKKKMAGSQYCSSHTCYEKGCYRKVYAKNDKCDLHKQSYSSNKSTSSNLKAKKK